MTVGVELRHLRYFVTLADELHFGHAAVTLGITQPALSLQIRQLESIIGALLFDRTSRSVRLTAAGEQFRRRSIDLLEQLQADVDEAARISSGQAGRIDLAFISSAAASMSGVLQQYRAQWPDVHVRLFECFTDEALNRVEQGSADIGIVRDPDDRPGLLLSPLLTERFTAVIPAAHPLAAQPTVTAAELAAFPLIFFPVTAGARAAATNLQPFREAGIEPTIAYTGSSWNTILHLVAAEVGISVAPISATTGSLPQGLTCVALAGTQARSQVALATRHADRRAIVQDFLELASRTVTVSPKDDQQTHVALRFAAHST